MPLFLILLQLLIPVALLGWMVVRPLPGRRLFLVQATGIGISLLAIARVGMWLMPPWWTPWVSGAAWVAAVCWRLPRTGSGSPVRARWETRAGVAITLLLALAGIWGTGSALAARGAPTPEVFDVANPLGPGTYLVAHGGRRSIVNGHLKTLDPDVERFRAWRGQSYALDLVGINRLGFRADGLRPTDPSEYVIFGAPVYAPCAGKVAGSENALPDLEVPLMDSVHLLGNHVLLECGGIVLVFAHLRQGSVRVELGEHVPAGHRLGEVGNSGNTSEPHLHLHAQRPGLPGSPVSGEPIGLRIDGRWLVRNDRIEGKAW